MTKEEDLLNQITQEPGPEEEGNIYEEDFQQVLEHIQSAGTKRKRGEPNSVLIGAIMYRNVIPPRTRVLVAEEPRIHTTP